MSFLSYRADALLKKAEALRQLDGLCVKYGLVPKSGDLYTEESWPNPDNVAYWPDNHVGAVLLTKPGTFPEHVAAVYVNGPYYYGGTTNGSGNHDMSIDELEHNLQRMGLTPAEGV